MTMQQNGPPPSVGESEIRPESEYVPAPLIGEPEGPRPPSMEAVAKWSIGGLLVLAIMGLCFGLGFGLRMATEKPSSGTVVSAQQAPGNPNFDVLNEIYSDLKSNYIDAKSLDAQALRQGAIDGLIKSTGDAHMGYLSQSAFLAESDDVTGSFSGIGATVQQKNGQLLLAPLPDTPAAHAGVKPDDVLLTVDGASVKGWSELQAVQKIRGKQGSTVKIGIKHNSGQQDEFTITRDTIKLDSVKSEALHDANGNAVTDVGYVRINQFTLRTPDELQKYLSSIQGKNYKGLVIDLRNNPGGVVDSVISVVGEFVNRDPALIVQSKDGSEKTLRPQNGGILTQLPLAVLVNHNSASASEIMAGALHDHHRAKLFGENTFGKGTENIFVPLKTDVDKGGISVTVGRWFTPAHTSIEGTGLKPDVAVTAADNAVLYRAVQYLQTGN